MEPLTNKRLSEITNAGAKRPPRHKGRERFLKGPIPLNWLTVATQLPGKTLAVAIVIWFKAGLTNTKTFPVCHDLLCDFGVSRHAGYRGLKRLESAGLIGIKRGVGRCPIVTLKDYRG